MKKPANSRKQLKIPFIIEMNLKCRLNEQYLFVTMFRAMHQMPTMENYQKSKL